MKVKETTAKRSGAAPSEGNSKALQGSGILASKNGKERTFSKEQWDLLPEGKAGWVISSGKPSEIKGGAPVIDPDKKKVDKVSKEVYQLVFGEEAGSLSIIEILNKIKEFAEKDIHFTHSIIDDTFDDDQDEPKLITQEDLDLNPALAEAGHKVGDPFPKTEGGND